MVGALLLNVVFLLLNKIQGKQDKVSPALETRTLRLVRAPLKVGLRGVSVNEQWDMMRYPEY